MLSPRPRIEIQPPRQLGFTALLSVSAYGLFLVVPALATMMAVSVLHFGWLSFLVPLLTIAVLSFFLPFGSGNPHVTRLVRRCYPESEHNPEGFVVQLTVFPRLHAGARALLEDADDIGWLRFGEEELLYQGDAVRLVVPYERIGKLEKKSGGWRVFFLCGPWIEFSVTGLAGVKRFRFAERSAWILPTARQRGQRMHAVLTQKAGAYLASLGEGGSGTAGK